MKSILFSVVWIIFLMSGSIVAADTNSSVNQTQVIVPLNKQSNVRSSKGVKAGEVAVEKTGTGDIKITASISSGPANKNFYVFIKHDNWGKWTSGSTDSHRDGTFSTGSQGIGSFTTTISGSGLTYIQVVVRTASGSSPAYRYSAASVKTSQLPTQPIGESVMDLAGPPTISGRVSDVETGAFISGAELSINGIKTTTDSAGYYKFQDLYLTPSQITIKSAGYHDYVKPIINYDSTTANIINIDMIPFVGPIQTIDESSEETATIAVEDEAGYVHSLSETTLLTATSWPAKITGTNNPEIQWKGPDHQVYRMVMVWNRQDSKYLQISSEPSIVGNTMTCKIKSSCDGCLAKLYIYDDIKNWVEFDEIQTSTTEKTLKADIPEVSPQAISTFGKRPVSGKILEIDQLYSLGGSRVRITVANKTDYFYGVFAKDSIGNVLDTRILGGKESTILEFTAPNIPHIYNIFNKFNIYTEFNLGFFYLQAAYSIIFQEKPPTSYLDGIIDTIYATVGTNPENLYKMDPEELVFLFINLFKDDPKFRSEVLRIFRKQGSEKAALKAAKKLIAIQTIIKEAEALGYLIGSTTVEDNETYRISVYK